MATFTSPPSWPPDPPIFDGPNAKSSTLVQFAVSACMVFVQHLVQRLIGFGGLETGRALVIGNLVPAFDVLLTAFGGVRLGIGSTPPILLLDAGRRRDLPGVTSLAPPVLDLRRRAGVSLTTHSVFDLREETATSMVFVSGCMLLALLAGVWIIRTHISTEVRTEVGTSVYGSYPSAEEGPKAEMENSSSTGKDDTRTRRRGLPPPGHRRSEPHGDERKDDLSNDSDDDDDPSPPPPPPGPGTGLHHDDDRDDGENMDWKHLGVTFVLGYFVAAMLKVLRKLKTKAEVPRRHTGFEVNERRGVTDYGKEWDVLEGTYGFSRSKSNIDIASWPKTDFPLEVGTVPFTEAIPSAMTYSTAQNQTTPAVFSARQKYICSAMSKFKATVEKARAQFDLTRSMVAIQICLESFLEMFGFSDFAVLVVLPLVISVLRYRCDEQDDTRVVAGAKSQEPDDERLTEANEAQCGPNRREEDEDFVYLDQRVSAPPNVLANGNTSEQINIFTPWSSPRRSMERYATHYSELAEFIVRQDVCKLNDLDGDYKKDACVESITEEVSNAEERINAELAHDITWTLINDYADETVTEFTSFGSGDIGEEAHSTGAGHDSEWSSGGELDKSRGSNAGEEFEDAQEFADDFSDVESYATAEGSDLEMEIEFYDERVWDEEADSENLFEPCSDQDCARYIDDSYTEDELDDPVRLLPGSFPVPFQPQMLGQIPIWGTRSNRWSIFGQFDELREGEPLLASEAIDFGLPRSNWSAAVDSFRTPPKASAKTLPSTPPAVPRGRKMRLKEKIISQQEQNKRARGSEDEESFFPGLVKNGVD